MRNYLALGFVWLALLGSPAWAEKVLAVTEEFPPYSFTDPSGHVTGLSTEIVQEMFKRANVEYKISSQPWARAYRTAQDDANVAIFSIVRNEKREDLFKWVGVIATQNSYLFKLKERSDVKAGTIADLKPYVVGGVRDDARTQYLEKEGLSITVVTDNVMNMKKLQLKRIDAFAMDEMSLMALAGKHGIDFNSMEKLVKLDKLTNELTVAFSLKTPDETVERCRVALESMRKDGTLAKITTQWRTK